MFRRWGYAGIALVVAAQLGLFFRIEPLSTSFFFPLVWFGYIFVVDALVYRIQGWSLISSRRGEIVALFLLSIAVWWVYELLNVAVQNWYYVSSTGEIVGTASGFSARRFFVASLSFATVMPAVFETLWLFRALHVFDKFRLRHRHRVQRPLLFAMAGAGVFSVLAPILSPTFFFPLVWLGFFLLLDPINYVHGHPSIISHLADRRLATPLALLAAGFLCGFFWEFFNSYALVKWRYEIPFLGFLKIFEMPILGYLGYGPFAWSLYSIWKFVAGWKEIPIKWQTPKF